MANSPVQLVRDSLGTGAYRFTEHAEREREADTIPMTEIEEAFGGARQCVAPRLHGVWQPSPRSGRSVEPELGGIRDRLQTSG